MTLRCKPGDLAVFVKSLAGNEGCIVECIRLATSDELDFHFHNKGNGPVWFVDRPVRRVSVGDGRLFTSAPLARDCHLRPIRAPGLKQEEVDALYSPAPMKQPEREYLRLPVREMLAPEVVKAISDLCAAAHAGQGRPL